MTVDLDELDHLAGQLKAIERTLAVHRQVDADTKRGAERLAFDADRLARRVRARLAPEAVARAATAAELAAQRRAKRDAARPRVLDLADQVAAVLAELDEAIDDYGATGEIADPDVAKVLADAGQAWHAVRCAAQGAGVRLS